MLVAGSDEGYRVFGTEYEFDVEVGTKPQLRIRGKIDRIDETPDGLTVIDYKTGQIPSRRKTCGKARIRNCPCTPSRSVKHPEASGQKPPHGICQAAVAWRPETLGARRCHSGGCEEVIKNVLRTLQEKRDAVESGDFRVKPTPTECPSYCAMKHICRVNAFSRHKS